MVSAFMSDARQGEGGMEFTEPSLEESLDAIDDVFMDRLPGEGERIRNEQHGFSCGKRYAELRYQHTSRVE